MVLNTGTTIIIVAWTLLSALACWQFAWALRAFIGYQRARRRNGINGAATIAGQIFISEMTILTITFAAYTLLGPLVLLWPTSPRPPFVVATLLLSVAAFNLMAWLNRTFRKELESYTKSLNNGDVQQ